MKKSKSILTGENHIYYTIYTNWEVHSLASCGTKVCTGTAPVLPVQKDRRASFTQTDS